MKSQKIINLKERSAVIIKWFVLLLSILFLACVGSIIGLSLTSPYNDILTLARPEFLATTLILVSTITAYVGNLLYCRLKRSKAQRLGIVIVSLNLPLLFLTVSLILNESLFQQIPIIDVFKWSSAVILGYNIFSIPVTWI